MPRPRKIHLNKTLVFVTSSIEEGILLPQNPLMQAILLSCLARAQFHSPAILCHFLFEGNHVHLIFLVDDPSHIYGFLERFKTESAHAINILLDRGKRTVWCAGYDSPVLLTAEDVIAKIVYTYTNPSKDCLADSIEQYRGLHSYNYIKNNQLEIPCPYIARKTILPLEKENYSVQEYQQLAQALIAESEVTHTLKLEPDAWMKCFPEITDASAVNQKIYDLVSQEEEIFRLHRLKENKFVPSSSKLLSQSFDLSYKPNRSGRRTYCISSNKDLRKRFIKAIKALIEKSKEVYQRWITGDFSIPYPLGLYPPNMPKQAHLIRLLASC